MLPPVLSESASSIHCKAGLNLDAWFFRRDLATSVAWASWFGWHTSWNGGYWAVHPQSVLLLRKHLSFWRTALMPHNPLHPNLYPRFLRHFLIVLPSTSPVWSFPCHHKLSEKYLPPLLPLPQVLSICITLPTSCCSWSFPPPPVRLPS